MGLKAGIAKQILQSHGFQMTGIMEILWKFMEILWIFYGNLWKFMEMLEDVELQTAAEF
jgi:hypothetical protein